jgi:hypothetical protein
MKKIPIEEVIEQTEVVPYDNSTTAWRQVLNKHRNATHQQLLDALAKAVSIIEDEYPATDCRHPSKCGLYKDIDAASFVEVEE